MGTIRQSYTSQSRQTLCEVDEEGLLLRELSRGQRGVESFRVDHLLEMRIHLAVAGAGADESQSQDCIHTALHVTKGGRRVRDMPTNLCSTNEVKRLYLHWYHRLQPFFA